MGDLLMTFNLMPYANGLGIPILRVDDPRLNEQDVEKWAALLFAKIWKNDVEMEGKFYITKRTKEDVPIGVQFNVCGIRCTADIQSGKIVLERVYQTINGKSVRTNQLFFQKGTKCVVFLNAEIDPKKLGLTNSYETQQMNQLQQLDDLVRLLRYRKSPEEKKDQIDKLTQKLMRQIPLSPNFQILYTLLYRKYGNIEDAKEMFRAIYALESDIMPATAFKSDIRTSTSLLTEECLKNIQTVLSPFLKFFEKGAKLKAFMPLFIGSKEYNVIGDIYQGTQCDTESIISDLRDELTEIDSEEELEELSQLEDINIVIQKKLTQKQRKAEAEGKDI